MMFGRSRILPLLLFLCFLACPKLSAQTSDKIGLIGGEQLKSQHSSAFTFRRTSASGTWLQEHVRAQLYWVNMQLIEDANDRWLKTHYGEGNPTPSDLASSTASKTLPVCPDHETSSGFGY